MTDKQAFEAWFAENFEPHDRATTYGHVVVEDAWNAALAWLRSQGEPIGEMSQDERGEWSLHWNRSVPFGAKLFLAPHPAIPDGYRLVPVEPTQEMVMEGCRSIHCPVSGTDEPYYTYRAMLAAAPEPSK